MNETGIEYTMVFKPSWSEFENFDNYMRFIILEYNKCCENYVSGINIKVCNVILYIHIYYMY